MKIGIFTSFFKWLIYGFFILAESMIISLKDKNNQESTDV